MGIAKRGGQCLMGIYSNLDELNIKIFITFTRSVPDKLTETKKPPENHFISPLRHQLTRPFATAFAYWLEQYLVIPWESTGAD